MSRRPDDQGSFVDRSQVTGALTLGALGDDGIYLSPPPLYHLELDPAVFVGTTKLRVLGVADVNGKLVAALPSPDTPYRLGPAFSGMPKAIADQDFTSPVLAVGGTTSIRNFELGDGYFVHAYPHRVAFGGGIDRNFFNLLRLSGRLDGAFNLGNGRFNLVGQVEGCLLKKSICGGATASSPAKAPAAAFTLPGSATWAGSAPRKTHPTVGSPPPLRATAPTAPCATTSAGAPTSA